MVPNSLGSYGVLHLSSEGARSVGNDRKSGNGGSFREFVLPWYADTLCAIVVVGFGLLRYHGDRARAMSHSCFVYYLPPT